MRQSVRLSSVLQGGGFALHGWIGRRFQIDFCKQSWLATALFAVPVVLASAFDRSLVLGGRDVGLFEHPAIWAFFGLQIALPLSIRRSLVRLAKARATLAGMSDDRSRVRDVIVRPFLRFISLREPRARAAATFFYGAGLSAFVWNTFQNQMPTVVVPYDFWDSKTFQAGFWVTRVYKLYLFVWLLPYVALVHAAVISVTLRLIRNSRLSGRLKLIPFHPDEVGGLGFVPGLVTTPVLITLLLVAPALAGAFEVHRALDITPVTGLLIVLASAILAYLVPMTTLRTDIVALKREALTRIRALQQEYYRSIVSGGTITAAAVTTGNEALEYFEKLSTQIRSIPNYPHLKRLVGVVSLATTPSVVSILIKLYPSLLAVLPSAPTP
jgi:hypothetical protein